MTARPAVPVGAHVPVAGGVATGGLAYARKVDAEAIQVFLGNPRGWAQSPGIAAEDAAMAEHVATTGLPVFVHSPYLINLGSPDAPTLERSVASVRHCLARAAVIGARGVVVHTGSAVEPDRREAALRQVGEHLLPILDAIPQDGPRLLLEPMAGQGAMLCARVEELGPYLDALKWHPMAGICLDTCHAFAAGHDLTAPDGVDEMLRALDRTAGTARLALIHANDSADECGSARDHHRNIGAGTIGEQGFARLLAHPLVTGVPWVVETPGKAEAHAADIVTLKRLRG